MPEEIQITEEEYNEIKNKELSDNFLDIYEDVDIQDDADDIILISHLNNVDQDYYDEIIDNDQIYRASDNSLYVDKDSPFNGIKPGKMYSGIESISDCSDINNNFDRNLKISKYYTLGEVSKYFNRIIDKKVKNKNYTKYQIACNLKSLAINVLDKIKEQYPDMVINSTIRNNNANSEHETGQAADIYFPRHKKKDYYYIALWIYENISFNQLFLEYRPSKTPRGGWVHVSYAPKGNQIYGASKFWGTMVNDKFESPGARMAFTNPLSHCDWYA